MIRKWKADHVFLACFLQSEICVLRNQIHSKAHRTGQCSRGSWSHIRMILITKHEQIVREFHHVLNN
jgi:hypothetical protein